MFKSGRRAIVTPQSEHLRLMGALATLWGNDDFDSPPIERSSMIMGMGLHDRGYGFLDNSPIGGMSEEEWNGIARRGFYMQYSDIVADTIARYHIRRLASHDESAERKAMTAEFSQIIDERLKQHNLSKALFDRMDRVTELCDRISFDFCMDAPDSGAVSIFPRNDEEDEIQVQYHVEDGMIRVTPWPFSVNRYDGYLIAYGLEGYPDRLDPFILLSVGANKISVCRACRDTNGFSPAIPRVTRLFCCILQIMDIEKVGIFLPVSEVFPDTNNDFETFKSLLGNLSLTDSLFWCARLNLIISDPEADHITKQNGGLGQFFTTEEINRVNDYACKNGGAERVTVFFRGQILELIRWIALYCKDFPNDGTTFENPEIRRNFAKVLLIASDIWSKRVFGENRFSLDGGITIARKRALGAIRKSIEATSPAPFLIKSIGRGWTLFSKYFSKYYTSFDGEFQKATQLSVEEYYICSVAIAVNYMNPKSNSGLFNLNELVNMPSYGQVIKKYLDIESQNANGLKTALWGNVVLDSNNIVTSDFNYLPIRENPIYCTHDGRAIILDPIFFSEKMTVGPLFLLPKETQEKAFTGFGKTFEDYVCDILNRMFPDLSQAIIKRINCNITGKDQDKQEFEIDACLNDIAEVVLFETKTGFIREDKILVDDYELFLNHLREKYVKSTNGNKGMGQLSRVVKALASRKWLGNNQEFSKAKRVYPVLIVQDPLLNASGYGEFFASEFFGLLVPDSPASNGQFLMGSLEVALPIILTIDDLENLETSIEHFGFRDMLSDYSKSCPDRFVSLHNFIATSRYNQKMYQNKSIANSSIDIVNRSKKAFFPDAPDFEFPS